MSDQKQRFDGMEIYIWENKTLEKFLQMKF